MTANNNFKRRVRARAAKTGESYTAALWHFRHNPKGQIMDDNTRSVLDRVAAGQLPPDVAYLQLRQFRGQEPIGGPVSRIVVTGRFLNIDVESDPQLQHVVAEPSPGWTASDEGEDVVIAGPRFTHGADERTLDADGKPVSARRLEGWGDCVLRLKAPARTRLGGEMMAWRIVTPGVKMSKSWVFAEHASVGTESDEDDDPYRKALNDLASGAVDVGDALGRLRGIRSPG